MKQVFNVGQSVVHLSHGVGKVVGVESREFGPNKTQAFYILEIEDCGAPKKVFVPIEAAEQRLRALISKADANKIVEALEAPMKPGEMDVDHQTWNRRYRDYMEKIHTGDAFQIVEVLRALYFLQHEKDLSFGERKLLDQAEQLINAELNLVLGPNESVTKGGLSLIKGGK